MPDSEQTLRSKPPIASPTETRWETDGYTYVRSQAAPYDFRGTEWQDYGQSGGSVYYAVCNGRGALSWRVLLGTYVNDPHGQPSGDAIDWHYPPDMDRGFEGERDCDLLPGGKCRGDFGYSVADPLLDEYLSGGEDAVFAWLKGLCDEEFPNV